MFRKRIALALVVTACGSASTAVPDGDPTPPPTSVFVDPNVTSTPTPKSTSTQTGSSEDAAPSPPATSADTGVGEPTANDPAEEPVASTGLAVEPDPDFQEALARAGFPTGGGETDFSLHTINYADVFSGGVGRDGIPPIYDPRFQTTDVADEWLSPLEPVIALEVNGAAKAYPLRILTWHEIANDEIGGVPVAVTFCPLCNSAVVFDRRLEGTAYTFGVSGNLRNSDLVMWDHETQSWWQQLTGEGIVGENAGKQLKFIPAPLVSWETFRGAYPGSEVLSREAGYLRAYGRNPYADYDRVDQSPFPFFGDTDGRLLPKERVATIEINGQDAAFPFTKLDEERVVNYGIGGTTFVVFYQRGTVSALDQSSIANSIDVGSTGVFASELDGRRLTFSYVESRAAPAVRDDETDSTWNILGIATAGPLKGSQFERIVHQYHFWFVWAAFKPDTLIYFGGD